MEYNISQLPGLLASNFVCKSDYMQHSAYHLISKCIFSSVFWTSYFKLHQNIYLREIPMWGILFFIFPSKMADCRLDFILKSIVMGKNQPAITSKLRLMILFKPVTLKHFQYPRFFSNVIG